MTSRLRAVFHARAWRAFFLALVLGTALTTGHEAPGAAQENVPATPLGGRIADVVRSAGLGGRVGIVVHDLSSDRQIFSQNGDLPLNPASNMKLVTAAAALIELGPEFQMRTGLYGHVEDGRVAHLVLRGYGDPSLRMSDLVELAEGLADRGVRAVDHVIVDGSYFDGQILPPAFEQQPDEVASFRAAVGAVSVEQSSYVLRVIPGPRDGAPAVVRLAAPGYFDVENDIKTTGPGGPPNIIASQRGDGDRMELRLSGSIPTGILGVGYRRRVENPLAHAGHAMAEALGRAGIRGARRVQVGNPPSGLPLLSSRDSEPLASLLHRVGKYSDNFVAEMVLKVLGAEKAQPGTSERGAQVLQELLERAGVAPGQATIVNGSGLFDGNLIAASHITKVLRHVWHQPGVRAEYLSQLAIGGTDGTLARRMRDLPAARIVRAKTGTLNDVISLSGYVLGKEPGRAVAFSFLGNGMAGKHGAARRLADDIVRAIADDLHD